MANKSTPLRILVAADVPCDPNSGAAGTVYQMNQALKRLGHSVDEIWASDLGRWIRHGNLHYLLELPYSYRRILRDRLRQRAYDVVEFNQPHAHLAASYFHEFAAKGIFINRSHGHEVRIRESLAKLVPCDDPGGARGRSWLSRLLQHALDRHWGLTSLSADGFHVSCTDDAEFLKKRYAIDSHRIGVITQGVPQQYLDLPTTGLEHHRSKRILYVGQLARFKAPRILAAAVTQVLSKCGEATFTWVCGVQHHQDARSLFPTRIQQRITLLDWMPQTQLISQFDAHGIFLFPSFCEGFGKAPLEAMSRGLCVVASDTGGMHDYIQNDRNGRLVPVGDVDALANCVGELLNNPEQAVRLGVAARRTAETHTWDRCAQDTVTFYRSLLQRKHAIVGQK